MTVVVRYLVAPCFASCTDESETSKIEKGCAKDLGERFGTIMRKATNSRRATHWIVDAHRGDGRRFVVRGDEKLTAFMDSNRQLALAAVCLDNLAKFLP